jgi:hypothetical protein
MGSNQRDSTIRSTYAKEEEEDERGGESCDICCGQGEVGEA